MGCFQEKWMQSISFLCCLCFSLQIPRLWVLVSIRKQNEFWQEGWELWLAEEKWSPTAWRCVTLTHHWVLPWSTLSYQHLFKMPGTHSWNRIQVLTLKWWMNFQVHCIEISLSPFPSTLWIHYYICPFKSHPLRAHYVIGIVVNTIDYQTLSS